MRHFSFAVATLTGLLAAGCALPDAPATFVGSVADSELKVAAVAAEGMLTFYACGVPPTLADDTRWFSGAVPDPSRVALESGGWELAGDLGSGHGTLTDAEGHVLRWSMSPAAGEEEGLYASQDPSGCRTGAIVGTGDDGQRWVQGAWCRKERDGASLFEQVTPILPYTRTAKGLRVAVELPNEIRDLVVERVEVP